MTSREQAKNNNKVHQIDYLARSTRGLEWVAAAEISEHISGNVTEVGHREIYFQAPATPATLDLRSVDDVFIVVHRFAGVNHTRAALKDLAQRVNALRYEKVLANLKSIRGSHLGSRFEVIGSFLGKRNYNREEIESAVGDALVSSLKMEFVRDRQANTFPIQISFRIHLRDEEAVLAIRVAETALHRRTYKLDSIPGTLHPPVAYAMAMLADVKPNAIILDPCCGAGTIIAEVEKRQKDVFVIGSDISLRSINSARRNLDRSASMASLMLADAGQLPLLSNSVDVLISNIPWGGAVWPSGRLAIDQQYLSKEIARIVKSSGRAIIFSSGSEMKIDGFSAFRFNVRLAGKESTISIFTSENKKTNLERISILSKTLQESYERYRNETKFS